MVHLFDEDCSMGIPRVQSARPDWWMSKTLQCAFQVILRTSTQNTLGYFRDASANSCVDPNGAPRGTDSGKECGPFAVIVISFCVALGPELQQRHIEVFVAEWCYGCHGRQILGRLTSSLSGDSFLSEQVMSASTWAGHFVANLDPDCRT